MDGIFIINKPKDYTSHDVVGKMRKILHTKKIGHAGTLDPMATGVLPVLVGKATKIEKYLIEHDKQYEAIIKLEEKTDTGDGDGNRIETKKVDLSKLNEENINNIFKKMIGRQKQIPPMYSAIKVNGKKLYEYARKGIKIELEPRDIEIYKMNLISLNLEEKSIRFSVSCSKGTYIRVLCEEIAEKLDTVGYMKELKRIIVGQFKIENSVTMEELENSNQDFYEKNIVPIEYVFKQNEKIILDEKKLFYFLNGVKLTQNLNDGIYRIYDKNMKFIGIGIVKDNLLKRDVILD